MQIEVDPVYLQLMGELLSELRATGLKCSNALGFFCFRDGNYSGGLPKFGQLAAVNTHLEDFGENLTQLISTIE